MRHPPSRRRCLWFILILLTALIGLSSCQSIVTPRIILWHPWDGEQATVINDAIERYSEIFDDVIIVTSYVPADEMIDRFMEVAPQGLGPDIFIGASDTLRELASSTLIMPLAPDTVNTTRYYTSSLSSLMYNNQLYAVPFGMRPLAMYYNRNLVDIPATTLNELIAQADAGNGVAISTQFRDALWGIQAFGGQLLGDTGQVTLNRGAFTNWMNWLLDVNANPQIFLSRDRDTLRQLFIEGRVAYYTGVASELTEIRNMMDVDSVGVVPLPAGPNGTSGPLMQVDALMFNASSSQIAHEKARELALFLTNLEQSTVFMRDLNIVPANRRVRVDLRTYPAISGFIAQTRTTIAIPFAPQVIRLLELGDDLLLRVLEGVIEPNSAAEELTSTVNAEFGLTTLDTSTQCTLSGRLVLWHSLASDSAEYLSDFVNQLESRCLGFEVLLEYIPDNNLIDTYLEATIDDDAPDLMLASSSHLQTLVEAGTVLSVERDSMQSFSPISQQTVTLDGIPYGIPVSLFGNVFYYNRDLIDDAPVTTDELTLESSISFDLSRRVDDLFWTLTAYNGISITENTIIPNVDEITNWVNWLTQIDSSNHIEITANNFLRKNRFLEGESAYYIDSNDEFMELSAQLDNLSVVPFPTGTNTSASPLVTSLALFISPTSDHINTSLEFADMLTHEDEQEKIVQTLRWIPVNITADQTLSNNPPLATIADILQSGIVINNNLELIMGEVSRAIDSVFRGEQAPDVIAQNLFEALLEVEASE